MISILNCIILLFYIFPFHSFYLLLLVGKLKISNAEKVKLEGKYIIYFNIYTINKPLLLLVDIFSIS